MTDADIQLILIQDPIQGRLLVCEVPNEIVLGGATDRLAEKFEMIGESGSHLSSNDRKVACRNRRLRRRLARALSDRCSASGGDHDRIERIALAPHL